MRTLIAVAIITLLGSACQATPPDAYDAQIMCHNRVKDYLKAPSQAAFESDGDFHYTRTGNVWNATGWVDAPNALGVKLRATYTCTATYKGDDNWLVSASVDQSGQ